MRPPSACGSCGRSTKQARRDDAGGALCPRCAQARRPPDVCGDCGLLKRVHCRRADGSAVCSSCNAKGRPPEPCARCGRVALVVARRDDGPRCDRCWEYERTGRRCGCAAPFLVDRACLLCAAGRDGRPELADAVRAWLVTNGHRARRSLRATAAGRILQAMLRGETPVSHQVLDHARPRAAVPTLRARLVRFGVLEARDERVAAVQLAVDDAASHAHPDDAGVLARYGRWVVLRGVTGRIASGKARPGTTKTAQAKIMSAAALLADLRRDAIDLAELPQPWLDDWVSSRPAARPQARAFVVWVRQQHLVTAPVAIDPLASADIRLELDDDTRWATLATLLHDDTVDVRDRVAGFLLVALGQPLTRIVTLTVDRLTTEEPARLMLGTRPLRMEPPIDRLLRRLAADAAARESPWLFPGQASHLSAGRLGERLAALGITSRLAARNAVWAALAAGTPPVVLAEKLGISTSAAERWSQALGAGRSDYVGLLGDVD
jgi:hypothetical protein